MSSALRIRVWDLPTRAFHWALVILAIFSFATGKIAGSWVEWHMRSGYAILTLLIFRLAWGVVGSETARFASFVRGPRRALAYARGLFAPVHPFTLGHNPVGGWMVLLLLAAFLAQALSGLFVDDEIANQGPLAAKASNAFVARMSQVHEVNQWILVAAAAAHVSAIAFYRFKLKVELVGPMVHGWKTLPAEPRVPEPARASPFIAAVLLACAAAFVYWLVVIYARPS